MRGSLITVAAVGVAVFGAAVWWAAGTDDPRPPTQVHATVAAPRTTPDAAIPLDAAPPRDALLAGGAFAALQGGDDTGFDDTDIYGGLLGDADGGVTGLGHYGTIGHGSGPRIDHPAIALGTPKVKGDLAVGVIRRIIKRSSSKLLYCYEKQLVSDPWLTGTLDVVFFIGPPGDVAMVRGEGFAEVAPCVVDTLRAISFPKPTGGGGVEVTDSFTFEDKSR